MPKFIRGNKESREGKDLWRLSRTGFFFSGVLDLLQAGQKDWRRVPQSRLPELE